MAAYGSIDEALAGLIYGLVYENETRSVQDGDEFDFGDPVFTDEGDETNAYPGDTNDESLVFQGVALRSQRSFVESEGAYTEYDAMNVMIRGMVWVEVPEDEGNVAHMPVYVIVDQTDSDYNKFTHVATNNYPTGAFFETNPNTDNLAVIRLNGPYAGTIET